MLCEPLELSVSALAFEDDMDAFEELSDLFFILIFILTKIKMGKIFMRTKERKKWRGYKNGR